MASEFLQLDFVSREQEQHSESQLPKCFKAAHIAVGVDCDGIKHVLGIWVQTTEGAKFWAGVLAELRNRGVDDVLIACWTG